MIRIFCGYDPREKEGFHVFVDSLLRTSRDYSIVPLSGPAGEGTNAFTIERFTIPERCGFSGPAIFLDGSDMMLRAPIGEIMAHWDPAFPVKVVKHDYRTRHARKYVGTGMEADNADYPRKNWSSVILWNCGHPSHYLARSQLREAIANTDGRYLHRFGWLRDQEIGELPREWNWLADEYGESKDAKLLHWTAGIPGFAHYATSPHAGEWHSAAKTLHSDR